MYPFLRQRCPDLPGHSHEQPAALSLLGAGLGRGQQPWCLQPEPAVVVRLGSCTNFPEKTLKPSGASMSLGRRTSGSNKMF